jgi:CheY-like chemotaxis protein
MDDTSTQQKILLVDDDNFILVVYGDGLKDAGYQVVTAKDGEEALEKMRSERPDLVLLDIIMPNINGFEVLKAVQADPDLSNIPIVVLTNLSQASDEKEAKRYGAVDFMTKSDVSFNEVLLCVQRWIDSNPQPATETPQ